MIRNVILKRAKELYNRLYENIEGATNKYDKKELTRLKEFIVLERDSEII